MRQRTVCTRLRQSCLLHWENKREHHESKGINQLKEAGYEIEAVPNKGYKLLSVPDTLSEEELKSIRKTAWVGQEIFYYPVIDSTIPGRSSWRRKITLPERSWSPDSRMQAEAEEEEALSPRREPAFL